VVGGIAYLNDPDNYAGGFTHHMCGHLFHGWEIVYLIDPDNYAGWIIYTHILVRISAVCVASYPFVTKVPPRVHNTPIKCWTPVFFIKFSSTHDRDIHSFTGER